MRGRGIRGGPSSSCDVGTNVHRSWHEQGTGNSKARRDAVKWKGGKERGGEGGGAGQEAKISAGFNPLVCGRSNRGRDQFIISE